MSLRHNHRSWSCGRQHCPTPRIPLRRQHSRATVGRRHSDYLLAFVLGWRGRTARTLGMGQGEGFESFSSNEVS